MPTNGAEAAFSQSIVLPSANVGSRNRRAAKGQRRPPPPPRASAASTDDQHQHQREMLNKLYQLQMVPTKPNKAQGPCIWCRGTATAPCSWCKGKGYRVENRRMSLEDLEHYERTGMPMEIPKMRVTCTCCKGRKVMRCSYCRGSGVGSYGHCY